MNPKLDLKREVSAPCWALKQLRKLDTFAFEDAWFFKHLPIDGSRLVRVRVITERAWREIKKALKNKL